MSKLLFRYNMYFSITGMDDTKKSGNSTFTSEEKGNFKL